MHLAHIKVGRKDKRYHSTFSNSKFTFYQKETKRLMEEIINRNSSMRFYFSDELSREMESWYELVLTKGIEFTYKITGRYTIETRELQLDVLSLGMDIYVNELDKYCTITKVEVNSDHSVNYHVDEYIVFDEKPFNNHYNSVDEWFEVMYPHLNKFEDLIEYRYEKHPVYEIYNKHARLANKAKFFELTQDEYDNDFGIKKEIEVVENEVIIDSDSEYEEVKENHYKPVEVYEPQLPVKEDSGRATFAVVMLSMLFIGLVMLTVVVTNL